MFFKLFKESVIFAFNALVVNKLRTLLSLLGITIGIFAIISVFTMVDSLEKFVQGSVESLGNDVIFVQKWPWAFGSDYPWWKYMNRPVPQIEDFEEIKNRSRLAEAVAYNIYVKKTIQQGNNSVENIEVVGVSENYERTTNFELREGRYLSEKEISGGKNSVLIGADVAEYLFGEVNPIDKYVRVFGRNVKVIGVFAPEGESMFGNSLDEQVVMPVNFVKNFVDLQNERFDPFVSVKAKAGVSNEELKDELRGILRAKHKLKPLADDDFALNETSLLSKGFDGIFTVISFAGWVIGGFSILVGGFGIANIMFVSVKERTSIIGIQKSLGAKNYFILLQFLFESIVLCLLGGIIGLLIVFGGTLIASSLFDMDLSLTMGNIVLGLSVSAIIGIISGFMPAYSASRMDPVEAIRSN